MIRRHLTYSNVAASIAIFLAWGGGALALNRVPASNGTITGCFAKRTGQLRVLTRGRACTRREQLLTWQQRTSASEIAADIRAAAGGLSVASAQRADSATTASSAASANTASSAGTAAKANEADTAHALTAPEAFREIGAADQPAFAAGWDNESASDESTAAFYLDAGGVVHLKGTVNGGSGTIFTLPVGYRPAKVLTFGVAACGAGSATLGILAGGEVKQLAGTLCSLDGVTFRAGS